MNPEFDSSSELEKNPESSYQEQIVPSFSEAVERAIELSYIETQERNIVALVDIDGALIEDDKMKIPFFSHRFDPRISDQNRDSMLNLIAVFKDSVRIVTNRGSKDNPLWNTGKVIGEVRRFLESNEVNIEIFKSLLRQFPFLKMGDTEKLIQNLGEKVSKCNNRVLNIYAIEDWSIASPNRGSFYKYISKEVKRRYKGILRVQNFVVKR